MKKLVSIFLLLALVVTLCSCSGGKKQQLSSSQIASTEQAVGEQNDNKNSSKHSNSKKPSGLSGTNSSGSGAVEGNPSADTSSAIANSSSLSGSNPVPSQPATSGVASNAASSQTSGAVSQSGASNKAETSSKSNHKRPTVSRPNTVIDEKENIDASAPQLDEKGINKTWSIYFAPESLRDSQNVDAYSMGLSIREDKKGNLIASYAMIGYKEVHIDTIIDEERYAIAEAITSDREYFYDAENSKGRYFSWREKGMTSHGKTWNFDDVLAEYYDVLIDDDGIIRLPSEVYGDRVIYQAQYVPCKYDTKTGKLEIEGKFPLKNLYIEGNLGTGKYKYEGKVYSF